METKIRLFQRVPSLAFSSSVASTLPRCALPVKSGRGMLCRVQAETVQTALSLVQITLKVLESKNHSFIFNFYFFPHDFSDFFIFYFFFSPKSFVMKMDSSDFPLYPTFSKAYLSVCQFTFRANPLHPKVVVELIPYLERDRERTRKVVIFFKFSRLLS